VNKAAIYNLSGNLKCDHCGNPNHTAYKDGKSFCYKLIKDLKGIKENTPNENKSKSIRCRYCKAEGQLMSDCPKLLKMKSNEDSGLNHLFIGNMNLLLHMKSKFTATNSKHTSETKSNAKGYKHMHINLFHDLHGHDGLSRMRAKAKVLGIHLIGTLSL